MSSFLFKFTYRMTSIQLNLKNRTYYFYNDLINIKHFDAKKFTMSFGIYYISYVDKKPEWNFNSVNPFYLIINIIVGFTEEKDGDKYLNISDTDRNREVLKKYAEV